MKSVSPSPVLLHGCVSLAGGGSDGHRCVQADWVGFQAMESEEMTEKFEACLADLPLLHPAAIREVS